MNVVPIQLITHHDAGAIINVYLNVELSSKSNKVTLENAAGSYE